LTGSTSVSGWPTPIDCVGSCVGIVGARFTGSPNVLAVRPPLLADIVCSSISHTGHSEPYALSVVPFAVTVQMRSLSSG
jgi:hypothetical protein